LLQSCTWTRNSENLTRPTHTIGLLNGHGLHRKKLWLSTMLVNTCHAYRPLSWKTCAEKSTITTYIRQHEHRGTGMLSARQRVLPTQNAGNLQGCDMVKDKRQLLLRSLAPAEFQTSDSQPLICSAVRAAGLPSHPHPITK